MQLLDVIFERVTDFLDEDDLTRFLSCTATQHPRSIQRKIDEITRRINALGSARVHTVSYLMSLVARPEMEEQPPFAGEEACKKLARWVRMMRGSRIRGERRRELRFRLIELLSERLDLKMPEIPIASPIDMIICLHFSRIDSILDASGYFQDTEEWLDMINRRAVFSVARSFVDAAVPFPAAPLLSDAK